MSPEWFRSLVCFEKKLENLEHLEAWGSLIAWKSFSFYLPDNTVEREDCSCWTQTEHTLHWRTQRRHQGRIQHHDGRWKQTYWPHLASRRGRILELEPDTYARLFRHANKQTKRKENIQNTVVSLSLHKIKTRPRKINTLSILCKKMSSQIQFNVKNHTPPSPISIPIINQFFLFFTIFHFRQCLSPFTWAWRVLYSSLRAEKRQPLQTLKQGMFFMAAVMLLPNERKRMRWE